MPADTPTRGIIYAATGPDIYVQLAARSAVSLRDVNPDLEIDLFTDRMPDDPSVFDQIHILEDPWHRSKIDALRLSRFDQTLMLDCDTMVVGDITPIFDGLEFFDIAVAYDFRPNGFLNYQVWKYEVPPSMPQFNSGVVGVKRSQKTDQFFRDWAEAVRDHDMGRDQPTFRELLYRSDLRILTLPEVFNLLEYSNIRHWDQFALAPRVIHSPEFHNNFDRFSEVEDPVAELLGLRLSWKRQLLHGRDLSLAKAENREPRWWGRLEPLKRAAFLTRGSLKRLPAQIGRVLGLSSTPQKK